MPTVAMLLAFLPGLSSSIGLPLTGLVLLVLIQRYLVYRQTQIALTLWTSRLLMALGVIVWWWTFSSKLALEPAVGLLFLGAWLKLVEAQDRRDGYVLIYTGFLLAASVFLFHQTLWQALLVLVGVVMGFSALLQFELESESSKSQMSWLPAATVALAIPITLVWFLIFPRIAPLWAIPVAADGSRMGMSDTLRPGDVSQLGRDASLAFRVEFEGQLPPYQELYWRGITLGRFDDGTWRQHRWLSRPSQQVRGLDLSVSDTDRRYTVLQKASHRHWIYSLMPSVTSDDRVRMYPDLTLKTRWPITADMAFDLSLAERTTVGSKISAVNRRVETAFPVGLNPRSEALVRSLAIPGDSETTIDRVLQWYRSQPFVYTLEPTLISTPDFVDRFLFDTQSGFCEHYAYSFVVLLRLAGIPARIVGGYMGGEVNPLNGTVSVREMDAHAWAEVWVEQVGWVRFDPTGVVAPERVQRGALESLEDAGGFLAASPLSLLHLRDWQWINRIRLSFDDLNYRWQSTIMGYDRDQQVRALTRLLGQISPTRLLALFAAAILVTLIPIIVVWLVRRYLHTRQPMVRAVYVLDRELKNMGVVRNPGETLRAAVSRSQASEYYPEKATVLSEALEQAEALLYKR
ncbi:MAG: transglutaminaseTgpA domain-containing protein [Luminiphilus sp.]|nr:transglutaminaseTgpA domain-containing protein [Luminiphilus sp.]